MMTTAFLQSLSSSSLILLKLAFPLPFYGHLTGPVVFDAQGTLSAQHCNNHKFEGEIYS